jgi:hypothetical protein
MEQKARLQKKNVPSFLRDELDRFKATMERRLMKKLEKRFQIELKQKVKEEVGRRMKTIHEDSMSFTNLAQLMDDSDIPSPPSIPSLLSPPSEPESVSYLRLGYRNNYAYDDSHYAYGNSDYSYDDSEDYTTASSMVSMSSLSEMPVPPPSPNNLDYSRAVTRMLH